MVSNLPLAERMRPATIENFIGQKHLVGESGVIRKMIDTGNIVSMILWGPPGVGKTTLARIIAQSQDRSFFQLSAVHSGVKDVRETLEEAKKHKFFSRPNPILFIDEIHRFSKSQQDSLLGAVEQGVVTLIGATTENPSFEVIPPLLSRCQVYILRNLEADELDELIQHTLKTDFYLKNRKINFAEKEALFRFSGGDARKLLNIIEMISSTIDAEEIIINNAMVTDVLQQNIAIYDKMGEMHYDIISAFIKSVRGSDPNAAVYWLARMLEGGEDIKFIARRLLILAAEDIGLANPNALLLANTCFDAIHKTGMPEARIILSETAIYLATSPKSNSAYLAIDAALNKVKQTANQPVPLHLRNAPTHLMKDLGYGKNYQYAHDFDGNFVNQEFLPEKLVNSTFYSPQENQQENAVKSRLHQWWKGKYNY